MSTRSACVVSGAPPEQVAAKATKPTVELRANKLGTLITGKIGDLAIDLAFELAGPVYDVMWNDRVTYGQVHLEDEKQFSAYNFEAADVPQLLRHFSDWEAEAGRLMDRKLVRPAYDAVMKCSHLFNLLDARRAISVTERVGYIARVRALARRVAEMFVAQESPAEPAAEEARA